MKRTNGWALLAALLCLSLPCPGAAETAGSGPLPAVLRVADAVTLVLGDGQKVRLLGVEGPREARAAAEAANLLRRLAGGKRVRAEYGTEHVDATGVPLAYVCLEDGRLLNEEVIKRGYGFASGATPHRYLRIFRECQRQAREAKAGLWAHSAANKRGPAVPEKVADTQRRVEEFIALSSPPGVRLPGPAGSPAALRRGTARLFLASARSSLLELASAHRQASVANARLVALRRAGRSSGVEWERLRSLAERSEGRQVDALERVMFLCRDADVDSSIIVKVSGLALDVSEGRVSGAAAKASLARIEAKLR